MNYVPFAGGGEALASLLGNQVAAGISGYGEFAEQVNAGTLRLLAISSDERQEGRAGMGASFLAQNAGKRSVVLDLKDPGDRGRFLALVDTADALVENFRPGVMDRLGLGAEACARGTRASSIARSRASGRPGRCGAIRPTTRSCRACRA
jgi:hypothetical protein